MSNSAGGRDSTLSVILTPKRGYVPLFESTLVHRILEFKSITDPMFERSKGEHGPYSECLARDS